MINLTFFTLSFLGGACSSINYHLLCVVSTILDTDDYNISVLSYESDAVEKSAQSVFDDYGFAELCGRVKVVPLSSLDAEEWSGYGTAAHIVFCQHFYFADVLNYIKEVNPEVKIISWVHSIAREEYLSSCRMYLDFDDWRERKQNLLCKISDICVFDSKFDYNLACLDFCRIKDAVIIYPVTRLADENKCPINKHDYELLYIGRFDYRKGLESLIPCSYRLFLERQVRTVLLTESFTVPDNVITNSVAVKQFNILAQNGGLIVEPWIYDKNDYADYLHAGTRIAVFPSYYDAFNMAVYDCALAGLPLVVSNRCGVREVLDKDDNFLRLCNPYDIEQLYESIISLCDELSCTSCKSINHRLQYSMLDFKRDIAGLFQRVNAHQNGRTV